MWEIFTQTEPNPIHRAEIFRRGAYMGMVGRQNAPKMRLC